MKNTERSTAIILKTTPLGESDLLVHFYTPERGRIKGVARGARRSRKRFVNCLDVFSLVRIEYTSRRTGDLFLLESGKLEDAFPGIRSGFQAMSRASFMVELTDILFPWGVAEAEMFDLLRGSLERLSRSKSLEPTVMVFELRAMALGGFGIRLEACSVCGRGYRGEGRAVFDREGGGIACLGCRSESALFPGLSPETTRVMGRVQAGPWNEIRDVDFGEAVAEELRPVLRLHREQCLERQLRTARYLEPVS
ncbi:MAG: DNA repair protein RecO [Desulfobacteraceae bacterium]|jgi:DNA repair protein RecO (recombination protein O)